MTGTGHSGPPAPARIHVRTGSPADAAAILAMLDDAVRWLVTHGRAGQWGTEPFSAQPNRVDLVRQWAAHSGLRVAEADGAVAGAIVFGDALPYAPPPAEPELYVRGFVTDRRHAGHGIGTRLLDEVRAEAARQGVHLIRLDCWAGGDQALVRYYERAGFTPAERVRVGDWEGQVLTQRC